MKFTRLFLIKTMNIGLILYINREDKITEIECNKSLPIDSKENIGWC